MCGRYSLSVDALILLNYFLISSMGIELSPRYNIAPGQNAPIIIDSGSSRRMGPARWGIIPSWASGNKPGKILINSRAETIDRKPAFKNAFLRRRCLVPSDGYYEWKKEGDAKLPFRIVLPGKPVFAFAGIWEFQPSAKGDKAACFSIVTTQANPSLQVLHHRMPVILADEEAQREWVRPGAPPETLKELLKPYDGETVFFRVSRAVNSPAADSPLCIERLTDGQ